MNTSAGLVHLFSSQIQLLLAKNLLRGQHMDLFNQYNANANVSATRNTEDHNVFMCMIWLYWIVYPIWYLIGCSTSHLCEKFRIYSKNVGAFVLIENVNLSNVSLNSAESLIEMRTLPWSRDGNLIWSRYILKLKWFFRISQIQIKDEEWLGIDDWY